MTERAILVCYLNLLMLISYEERNKRDRRCCSFISSCLRRIKFQVNLQIQSLMVNLIATVLLMMITRTMTLKMKLKRHLERVNWQGKRLRKKMILRRTRNLLLMRSICRVRGDCKMKLWRDNRERLRRRGKGTRGNMRMSNKRIKQKREMTMTGKWMMSLLSLTLTLQPSLINLSRVLKSFLSVINYSLS